VITNCLRLDLFDLDFFTVSSILVPWTEEVSVHRIRLSFTITTCNMMGDWNRSLLLVVLWSWRILRELKVQNCWFIYLLCEQEANKLRGKYRKFKWLRVFVNVCAMFRKETQAMVYTGWQDHAWAVLEVAMDSWSCGLRYRWPPEQTQNATSSCLWYEAPCFLIACDASSSF